MAEKNGIEKKTCGARRSFHCQIPIYRAVSNSKTHPVGVDAHIDPAVKCCVFLMRFRQIRTAVCGPMWASAPTMDVIDKPEFEEQ
jgi:hypothetical protein